MVFSNAVFLFAFLPVTLLGYYLLRGRARNYWLLLVSLFPQLVAGPIVRYKDVVREIDDRSVTLADFTCGVRRFNIIEDFAESFSEVWLVWGDYTKDLPAVVELYQPDVVIYECAERVDRSQAVCDLAERLTAPA